MDRFLATHLRAAAEMAQAQTVALFVLDGRGALDLCGAHGLDQGGIDTAHAVWRAHREALTRGETVRVGESAVWPLHANKRLAALVYFDQAHAGFPSPHDQAHGHVLADRVRTIERRGPAATAVEESPEEANSRLLKMALRQSGGSVSATARIIGVNRDTVYYWAAKYGVNVDDYRPKQRR